MRILMYSAVIDLISPVLLLFLVLSGILDVAISLSVNSDLDWAYESACDTTLSTKCFEPAEWHTKYEDCGKKEQSPIDFNTSAVVYSPKLRPIYLYNYTKIGNASEFESFFFPNATVELTLINEVHTGQVDLSGDDVVISGSDFEGRYVLKQFHWHWGSDDSKGSEHFFNGRKFPMEMHLVHAHQTKSNDLAVIGYFVDVGPEENEKFEVLINLLPNISTRMSNVTVPNKTFDLAGLLPSLVLSDYFRYEGSLTTPPCSQIVTWTMCASSVITISERQMNVFRSLEGRGNHKMMNNFRPIQKLNGREVTASKIWVYSENVAASIVVHAQWMVLAWAVCLAVVAYV